MNALIKYILAGSIIAILGGIIAYVIPIPITEPIREALVYFLQYLGMLNLVMPMDTAFACLKILVNYILSVLFFVMAYFFARIMSS